MKNGKIGGISRGLVRNPWTDCRKIWHGWLRRVGDVTRHAKIKVDHPSGGVPTN